MKKAKNVQVSVPGRISFERVPPQVGDRVKYSRKFLRSIGTFTGEMPFARGTVRATEKLGEITLAVMDWNDDDMPEKVNVNNLTLEENMHE